MRQSKNRYISKGCKNGPHAHSGNFHTGLLPLHHQPLAPPRHASLRGRLTQTIVDEKTSSSLSTHVDS